MIGDRASRVLRTVAKLNGSAVRYYGKGGDSGRQRTFIILEPLAGKRDAKTVSLCYIRGEGHLRRGVFYSLLTKPYLQERVPF